ncbi:MAG: glycosyltransferase family 39 protein [Candidatus Levybacteria bacterium]|nr:glycosyltransferase family 39 protein [Candidatus Levybacteria bacterium]
MKFLKVIIPITVVVALSFWAAKPLFIPGFFPIHDDTQVARVYEMTKSIKDGMFPVRWVSDLGYGYGYPIFNFYSPLAYYIGSFFELFGFDALLATKAMMVLGILLSGIFMYLLAKEFWGKTGGIVSALLYVYAPFHAVDIYVRGDVSEFWAYAFIPLALLGFYKIYKTRGSAKWIILGALGYTGIILSHNLTAMMVTPFILIVILFNCYIAIKKKELSAIRYPLYAFVLGLSLSAFYFIPALLEQRYTNILAQIGGGAHFKDHFVCSYQLWQSQWGFGGSAPGCIDGASFMIGKIHLIFSLLATFMTAVFTITKKISIKEEEAVIILFCIVGLLASALLMLSTSEPLWSAIPLMAFFQFPWRFLLMASFFASILCGSLLWFMHKAIKNEWAEYLTLAVLVAVVILSSLKFFIPQTILNKTANDYTNIQTLRWTTSRISDEYMPKDFPRPTSEVDIARERVIFNPNDVQINSKIDKTNAIELDLDAIRPTKVHFNIAYFPSWKLSVDGMSQGSIVNKGYDVSLPSGKHQVEMKFKESNIEKVADLISLAGLVAIAIGIIRFKKKSKHG